MNPSPLCIGPLVPWCCQYAKPDGLYGIVLYGTDPEQVIRDNAAELPYLTIIGISWGKTAA